MGCAAPSRIPKQGVKFDAMWEYCEVRPQEFILGAPMEDVTKLYKLLNKKCEEGD